MSHTNTKEPKPSADEARGRKFAKAMENRYGWRQLTGEQLEQVISMAECFHEYMRQWRRQRTENP